MMGNSSNYNEILNVYSDMKNEIEYPHQYLKYPTLLPEIVNTIKLLIELELPILIQKQVNILILILL